MIAGQSPKMQWQPNADGVKRTIDEALAIAAQYVAIPDDVEFFEDIEGDLDETITARGPAVTKYPGQDVRWSDLVHEQTFVVPFLIRSDILESDEAIIAVIAHEMYELERLREIFAAEGRMFLEHFYGHTRPGNPGNLHDEAWDFADSVIEQYRKEGKP
jgi:hypothetical protein